ncbi:nuclear transport factor 2 family protein [Planktotalea sp.]|uniref:nuclear transport factor 2 family protein n=1 Tax=Planktotalea sp. TaxID=2029877 RepID=UPI003436DE00
METDATEVARLFWRPFRRSVTSLQRRMDVFIAGSNHVDGDNFVWVSSMGHLMGLFDIEWLGIQPTDKMVMLRYAEFHKVEDGKLGDTAFYYDIPHLMIQAGYDPFGSQTAAHMVQPGPAPHDALLIQDADQSEGQRTMDAMIGDLGTWQSGSPIEEELARTWHDDMIWWGPAGIGATYTIERYAKQHAIPFRAAFSERSGTGHIARIAESNYSGFFGWPNFTAKPTGGCMALPPAIQNVNFA